MKLENNQSAVAVVRCRATTVVTRPSSSITTVAVRALSAPAALDAISAVWCVLPVPSDSRNAWPIARNNSKMFAFFCKIP